MLFFKPTNVYIIIPALVHTGPIKGAIALANGLTHYFKVCIVALKYVDKDVAALLNPKISIISFSSIRGFWRKSSSYKALLLNEGNRLRSVSISFCFSADVVNFTMRSKVTIISSVRGNLLTNYYNYHGWFGYPAALIHYKILRKFNKVVAMSHSMANQLQKHGIKRISVIGNFIDEESFVAIKKNISSKTSQIIKFLFLGRLHYPKHPELLIQAMYKLKLDCIAAHLSIIGDGPMRRELEEMVVKYDLQREVSFYGNVFNPYELMDSIDFMVLPSESEGVPRAVLETLHLGIPCILRDVDANRELIEDGKNGFLFKTDDELSDLLIKVAKEFIPFGMKNKQSLIPEFFRYDLNVKKFKRLIDDD